MSEPSIHSRISALVASKPNNYVIINRPTKSVFEIVMNRPEKYNAYSMDMYLTIAEAIRKANKEEEVKFIVVRGNGKVFSSGNDLKNFSNPDFLEFDPQVIEYRICRSLCPIWLTMCSKITQRPSSSRISRYWPLFRVRLLV
jgi:hypothetical protein